MSRFLTALVWPVARFPASSVILAGLLCVGVISGGPVASEPQERQVSAVGEPKAKAAVKESHIAVPATIAVSPAVLAQVSGEAKTDPPPDLTGPDQRVPRALGQASFFPVKNMPQGAQSDLFMVPDGVGEFFALFDRDGNPVGVFSCDVPGTYSCVVVWLIDGKLGRDTHTITVGSSPPIPPGPTPPGPTPPGPTPPTPDPIPDSRLGFTRVAHDAASKLPAAAKAKAPALADNFEGVASAIAAGAIKTIEASLDELRTRNVATVDRAAWLPWFEAWQKHADATVGKLRSVNDYAEAYRETSDGLRRVR